MKLFRRQFLHLAASAAAIPVSHNAWAQTYPTRPVRLIVPLAAGGGTDVVARLLAGQLSEIWGRQVVVENRGGAGGTIGVQAVAQAAPDGYTILFATPLLAIDKFIYPSLTYDPVSSFAPVSLISVFPNLMVVPNSSPAKSVTEFIDYAKSRQGNLTYASSGVGTSLHLSGELFKRMTGIEMTHVPYRGAGPALNDLIPGRVDVMFGNLTSMLPQAQTGGLRGLAVTSARRSPFAPDIPTIAESGVPGFDVTVWNALFAPAKTPSEIIAKLHDEASMALAHGPVKQRLAELGAEVVTATPSELAVHLKSEINRWGPIIKQANIKPE